MDLIAIRDDFAFWQKNKYECYAAKPLWINLNDTYSHHIIFDDNIRLDSVDDCIVNIRLFNSIHNAKYLNVNFNSYKYFKATSILQPDLVELLNPNLKIDSKNNHYLSMIKNAEKSYEANSI
ncbi:RWD domain-containing [Brachionus plicatilis]|uniref:RWD domain-containing n=1 Tax=Brachionus plicatilis TaxID=10195 RepID=A0A3M7T352_BRAPC|nr:RWD domain-containing [Brachionus plicatilis]